MVFIIFMAVPTLLSKTIDAPAVLVARGKQAYKDSGAAIKRGGQKAKEKAEELADELLHSNGRGRSKTAAAAPPSAAALAAMEAAEAPEGLLAAVPAPAGAAAGSGEEAQAEAAAGEAAEEAEPSAPSAAEPGKPLSPFKPSRHLHLVESTPEGGEQTGYLTWTLLALILFIAALALLVIGIVGCPGSHWQLPWGASRRRRAAASPAHPLACLDASLLSCAPAPAPPRLLQLQFVNNTVAGQALVRAACCAALRQHAVLPPNPSHTACPADCRRPAPTKACSTPSSGC